MLEANEMKVLKKIVCKTKQIEKEANKSVNPTVSNLLIVGWKEEEEEEEEENGTNM